ncbi:type II toxin-antitoxin system HicB family antitoxin [Kaistella daneshvariae]|nr:type II toxin-antitoxin system HicB family antitoxin [Kaistella daneshvariae]
MKKIKVIIDWDQNFGAVSDLVPGCVATGKTFQQVKENYASALKFHLEGLEPTEIPKELSGKYELEYELTAQALLHRFNKILTRAALSRITGINERQLGHYVSGYRNPKAEQRKKIVEAFHQLGEEFLSVT